MAGGGDKKDEGAKEKNEVNESLRLNQEKERRKLEARAALEDI